jgi:hypothetical protein
MTRLVHSPGGFLRSIQMSSARLVAFVEGRLDRVFFDRLMRRALDTSGLRHQVYALKELPSATGGKVAVIDMFLDFRKRGLLKFDAFGKSMVCMFFVDKDADDYTKKLRRSDHLVYSSTYDLEGHIGSCGDLHRALADACGVTHEQSLDLVPNPSEFLANVATQWADWIALCLVSQKHSVNCGCTFDRVSQINATPLSDPDAAQLEAFKTTISTRLGIARDQFDNEFRTARRAVERSLTQNQPMRFFKGKWLAHVLQKHVESRKKPADANFNSVWDRVQSSLLAQIPATGGCSCCAQYEPAVLKLAASLQ